jgi:hypothetical protein
MYVKQQSVGGTAVQGECISSPGREALEHDYAGFHRVRRKHEVTEYVN